MDKMTVYEHQHSLEKYRAAFSNQRKDPYSNKSAFFISSFSLKSENAFPGSPTDTCISMVKDSHLLYRENY